MKRHKITRLGIARTFQNIRLFRTMTALENVLVGADAQHTTGHAQRALPHCRGTAARSSRATTGRWSCCEFMGLAQAADELAANLSYGDQRRLEIARAMATEPEAALPRRAGGRLQPGREAELMELIRKVRDQGYTVLLIEHDMRLVMGVTDRIVVLEFGRKIAEGTPAEIRDNPAVIAAYLGVDEEDAS